MTEARWPAAFLDRDGTLIVERNHLSDPAGVELIPGTVAALTELRRLGYALVIVTNQSGIARGFFTEQDFKAVQERLLSLLRAEGIELDAVYHCPHHPEITGSCDCRKPGPGMYRRAEAELGVDLASSAYFGDRLLDAEAARQFGGTGILVETGLGQAQAAGLPAGGLKAASLLHALALLPPRSLK